MTQTRCCLWVFFRASHRRLNELYIYFAIARHIIGLSHFINSENNAAVSSSIPAECWALKGFRPLCNLHDCCNMFRSDWYNGHSIIKWISSSTFIMSQHWQTRNWIGSPFFLSAPLGSYLPDSIWLYWPTNKQTAPSKIVKLMPADIWWHIWVDKILFHARSLVFSFYLEKWVWHSFSNFSWDRWKAYGYLWKAYGYHGLTCGLTWYRPMDTMGRCHVIPWAYYII